MANYRLDELELGWLSGKKYYLKATVNADKDDDYHITGTTSGNELVFHPGVIKGDKRIVFTCSEVDFSGYNEDQFLLISIYDNYSNPAEKKKKGGVVIADTIYPPPRAVIEYQFPKLFTIKTMLIKRNPGTYKFSVSITCDHAPALGEYKIDSFEFRPDTNNNDYQVMIFNLNGNAPAPASLPVSLSGADIEFDNFPNVLPFFFVEKDYDWDLVNVKKGTVYIE